MDCADAEAIETRLGVLVGQLNALHAQLVDLVVEAAATGAWHGVGVRSLGHWLTWQAGLSRAHAAELVRLAEATVTHPVTMGAFADGELTVDQAAADVGVPAHNDAEVAALAKMMTVGQIRDVVRMVRPPVEPPTPDEPSAPDAPVESLRTWTDGDGRFHLAGDLDAERGRIVDAALSAARDRLFRDGHPAVTWVDALIDVCERSLGVESVERRERFRVNLFLDPRAPVPARWADGTAVPDAIRRFVSCDETLVPTFVEDGRPVSVGRTVRTIPDRTRRLVLHRDKQCRVPWCSQTRWLQIHHVVHWEDGGRTDTANLAAMCPGCHRLHHRGEIGIHGSADQPGGLSFTDSHGRALTAAPTIIPPTAPPPDPTRRYERPENASTGAACSCPTAPTRHRTQPPDAAPGHDRGSSICAAPQPSCWIGPGAATTARDASSRPCDTTARLTAPTNALRPDAPVIGSRAREQLARWSQSVLE